MTNEKITRKWILDNFDIEKERKAYIRTSVHQFDVSVLEVESRCFEDFIEVFKNMMREELLIFMNETFDFDESHYFFDTDTDYNEYGALPSYRIIRKWEERETDEQVISKLTKREKNRIRKELKKGGLDKEREEYETWLRLQKKFGKKE